MILLWRKSFNQLLKSLLQCNLSQHLTSFSISNRIAGFLCSASPISRAPAVSSGCARLSHPAVPAWLLKKTSL